MITRESITTQRVLQRRLEARGFKVTQATLSRDIKELGLVKRAADGVYERPSYKTRKPRAADRRRTLHRALAALLRRVARVREFLLLHTNPGEAPMLALSIDGAEIPGVAGTIGGNDTVLVACTTVARSRALLRRLSRWAR